MSTEDKSATGPQLATYFIFLFWWLCGIALAKGFWSTCFAICLPPYAMYLLVEKLILLLP